MDQDNHTKQANCGQTLAAAPARHETTARPKDLATVRAMETTPVHKHVEPQPAQGRFLTMTEAACLAGKPARWAKDHLLRTPGAPELIEIPEPGDIEGTKPKTLLVREAPWIEFLESFSVSRLERMGVAGPGTRRAPVSAGLMSPAQRRKVAAASGRRAA
jgi:hypothetical protein